MGNECLCQNKRYQYGQDINQQIDKISNYILEQQLGYGTYSKVWKVKQIESNQYYACKRMKKSQIFSKDVVNQIMKQKMILSKLDHPFIVNLNKAFQDKKHLYLIMELMPYSSLRAYLNQNDLFNQRNARFVAICILFGLKYLRIKGIIHCDIKPQNILMDEQRYFRICDFGLSSFYNTKKNDPLSGTIGYIAPQRFFKQTEISYPIDYFSLGIVLYQMLVGEKPDIYIREGSFNEFVSKYKSPKLPQQMETKISKSCRHFVESLLEYDPKKRLGSKGMEEIFEHSWINMTLQEQEHLRSKAKTSNMKPIKSDQQTGETSTSKVQQDDIYTFAVLRSQRIQSMFKGYQFQKKDTRYSLQPSQIGNY